MHKMAWVYLISINLRLLRYSQSDSAKNNRIFQNICSLVNFDFKLIFIFFFLLISTALRSSLNRNLLYIDFLNIPNFSSTVPVFDFFKNLFHFDFLKKPVFNIISFIFLRDFWKKIPFFKKIEISILGLVYSQLTK